MIRESITGPRAWTRDTLPDEAWRLPMPDACAEEIEALARALERDPMPSFLLDAADYPLDACHALMAEARRRLEDGPGVVVVDRVPIEKILERPASRGCSGYSGRWWGARWSRPGTGR